MKQTIDLYTFRSEFKAYDRDNFSYKGQEALFNYLEQLEDECGIEIELDVIALCCAYAEYSNLEEIGQDYNNIDTIEDLKERTIVIQFDGGVIIQNF